MEFRGNRFFVLCLLVLSTATAWSQVRTISHVTRAGGGFSTTVLIQNRSVDAQTVTLQPYDEAGQALTAFETTLAGGATLSDNTVDLFAEGSQVSHFSITADDSVQVTAAYAFGADGTPAHVDQSAEMASSFRIYPGDWSRVFDGVALVNMGSVATDVWIAQKDFNGNILYVERITPELAPNAKALYVIGGPGGSAFTSTDSSYYEISSNQLMAITSLRGTLPPSTEELLWANTAQALSHSHTKRDAYGVPLIKDGSLYDVYEQFGYQTAIDRLFQADLNRLGSRGRLAEIFGSQFVNSDILERARGYSDAEMEAIWAAASPETRTLTQAYVDGFNRRIAQVNASVRIMEGTGETNLLPVEYKVLGSTPEYWTYKDVYAWAAVVQRNFSMNGFGTLQVFSITILNDLIQHNGVSAEQAGAMFNDLIWTNDPDAPTIASSTPAQKASAILQKSQVKIPVIREDIVEKLSASATALTNMVEGVTAERKKVGTFVKMGSYAWAVSGEKTQSGNPILFSGPQVGFEAPMIVHETSIESDVVTVAGMAIAGLPAVLVGRTPHHAWAFQSGHADVWDHYLATEENMTLDRVETIKVLNGEDFELEVMRTEHGPVITEDIAGFLQSQEFFYAWKYANWGYEFNFWEGITGLATAQSVDEFGAAVRELGLAQHVIYTDVDNNLAYWLAGRLPKRPEGDYRFPQGVLEGQPILEWSREDLEPMVFDLNPENGYFAGWNTKTRADIPDVTGTNWFGPYQRAHKIQDQLADMNNLTFEEVRDLSIEVSRTGTTFSGGNPWQFVEPYFTAAVNNNPTPERLEALEAIQNWNGYFIDGPVNGWYESEDFNDEAVLIFNWMTKVLDNTFNDELVTQIGFNTTRFYLRLGALLHSFNTDATKSIVNNYDWFTNADPDAPQTSDGVIVASLDQALAELGERPWAEGARDRFRHSSVLLGNIHLPLASHKYSYAQCVEHNVQTKRIERQESIYSLGQSGTILGELNALEIDPNYDSMKDLFDNFILREFENFEK